MAQSHSEKQNDGFSGGFVNIDDRSAMEHWARNMCRGLDLKHAAAVLGTAVNVPDVAHALMDQQVESPQIEKAIVKVCEDELRQANELRGVPPAE